MSRKLTDKLRDAIIAKQATGWSYERCAAWLKRSHTITITPQSLHELVKRHRAARADASKAVARQTVAPSVGRAMRTLLKRHANAVKILRLTEIRALKDPLSGVQGYARALAAYAKIHELVQKASGIDQADGPSFEGLADVIGLALAERNAKQESYITEHFAAAEAAEVPTPPAS